MPDAILVVNFINFGSTIYINLPCAFKCSAARVCVSVALSIYTVRLICFAKILHLSGFLWYKYWMTAWSRFILCLLVGCLKIFCFFADLKASQLWSSHALLDVFCSVSLLCVLKVPVLIFAQGYAVLINQLCSIGLFQSKRKLNLCVRC